MAHTLLLVRHAKAVTDAATDAERPLAGRGARDAQAAGRWLVDNALIPDHAVVSDARRAVETWEAIASELAGTPAVSIDARVYDNTVQSLLAVLQEVPEDVATVAIVGHNPTMHALATSLDDGLGDDRARADLEAGFPTAAIAVLDVAGSWAEVMLGAATLRELVVPRG